MVRWTEGLARAEHVRYNSPSQKMSAALLSFSVQGPGENSVLTGPALHPWDHLMELVIPYQRR